MYIYLENFCLIKKAEMELNSITVIGAENDSGKSTIGKVIFGTFYSIEIYKDYFYELVSYQLKSKFDKISLKDNSLDIKLQFENILMINENNNENNKQKEKKMEILKKLKNQIDETVKNYLYKDIKLNFEVFSLFETNYISSGKNTYHEEEKKQISKAIDSIKILLETIDSRDFLLYHKTKTFYEKEISDTIKNFNNKENPTKIGIQESTYQIVITINDEYTGLAKTSNYNKIKDVIYIETPLFLDIENSRENSFRKTLREKLQNKKTELKTKEAIEVKESISKMINSIILGKLYYDEIENKYKFKRSDEDLQMKSVASGIKSFGILSLLLENNHLTEDTILIIDEPEVHLHPKWQIKYAEILCLLAKKIGVKILVNSHSPYFIEAISVYSNLEKYNLKDTVKFYTYECYEDGNILIDKTNNLGFIYNKLAEPYDTLSDEKYKGRF